MQPVSFQPYLCWCDVNVSLESKKELLMRSGYGIVVLRWLVCPYYGMRSGRNCR